MSKYVKYRSSGLGQALNTSGSSLGPISSGFYGQGAAPSPGPYASGYVYSQQTPAEDNTTLNSVLGSVTSILGAVGTAVAQGYSAKVLADAQSKQAKALQAMSQGQGQPVIIQQSGSSTGLIIGLGLGGLALTGILYIALKK